MAAIDEVAELYSLMHIHGLPLDTTEDELRRLLSRLKRLNRKIDDELND